MPAELMSVEQVAERLGLHVRTVRNYVRDGRLKAVRIGKQYRIASADLAELTGGALPVAAEPAVARHRRVEVSSVVQVDAIDQHDANRLSTLVTASVAGRGPQEQRLTIHTVYDEQRASMKVIVTGGLADCAEVLRLIGFVAEDGS